MLCIRRPYPGRGNGDLLRSWAIGTIVVLTFLDSGYAMLGIIMVDPNFDAYPYEPNFNTYLYEPNSNARLYKPGG